MNVAEGGDMQSVICAAQPRTNPVAKRKARATSIHLEEDQLPPPAGCWRVRRPW
jgi:hypothetical protein